LTSQRTPYPLSTKPDLDQAARRWAAFYEGDLIDRPVVTVSAPWPNKPQPAPITYRDQQEGDIDELLDRVIAGAEASYQGGESVPSFGVNFGVDMIAVLCGSEFRWSNDSDYTYWAAPCVEDWEAALPFGLRHDHPLWQRMLRFYERAAERLAGKVLLRQPDLVTNLDLLAGLRGPERLCADLLDHPEQVDRAMECARAVFRELWTTVVRVGKLDERGCCNGLYSMDGAALLQCDFSYLISPAMFRRWALPALEEEAALVNHAYYHWDGPGALRHFDALVDSKGLFIFGYVPEPYERHSDYIELYKRVQARGKAVAVWGEPEEMKLIHRELRPEKTMYATWTKTPAEADALLEWFVRHT
jgi:5-methyltetrahydrofolate--homocysteine methyltransferase